MPSKVYKVKNHLFQKEILDARSKTGFGPESKRPLETMHAIIEAAAVVTRDADLCFEDFMRIAICAWDCTDEEDEDEHHHHEPLWPNEPN